MLALRQLDEEYSGLKIAIKILGTSLQFRVDCWGFIAGMVETRFEFRFTADLWQIDSGFQIRNASDPQLL
jgi:hypothetical protein